MHEIVFILDLHGVDSKRIIRRRSLPRCFDYTYTVLYGRGRRVKLFIYKYFVLFRYCIRQVAEKSVNMVTVK